MTTKSDLLSTGEMARLSGSTLRTVRFYEQEGLIRHAKRSCGGHRQFDHSELKKLKLALDLREAGMSVQDVKELFELKSRCDSPPEASQRMRAMLNGQIDEMQTRIARLRRLREELSSMVSMLGECNDCEGVLFRQKQCGDCDVLGEPELPRAIMVLWGDRKTQLTKKKK